MNMILPTYKFCKSVFTNYRYFLYVTRNPFIRNLTLKSDFNYFKKHLLKLNTIQNCISNPIPLSSVISIRAKHSKRRSTTKDEDSESEDEDFFEEEDDDDLTKDYKVLNIKLYSTRMDTLLKKCLNISNKKIEEAFYDGKVRVNGKKMLKKSLQLSVGDEVDYIIGTDPHNENFLQIQRIILKGLSFEQKDFGRIIIKLHLFKSLTVENYKESWQARTEESDL